MFEKLFKKEVRNEIKVESPSHEVPLTMNQMERLAKENFAMNIMGEVTMEVLKGVGNENIKTSKDVLLYISEYLAKLAIEIKD